MTKSHEVKPTIPEKEIIPQNNSNMIYIPTPEECDIDGDYLITEEDGKLAYEQKVDIDKNNIITIDDGAWAQHYLGKILEGFIWPDHKECDYNNDGVVNKKDFEDALLYKGRTQKGVDINNDGKATPADYYILCIEAGYEDPYGNRNNGETYEPQHYGWVPKTGASSYFENIWYDCFETGTTEGIAQTFKATTNGYLETVTIKMRWDESFPPGLPKLPNTIMMGIYDKVFFYEYQSMYYDICKATAIDFSYADEIALKTLSTEDTGWTEVTFDFSGYDFWIAAGQTYGFRFTSIFYVNNFYATFMEYDVRAGSLPKSPPYIGNGPYDYGVAIWDRGTVADDRNDEGGFAEDLTFEIGELHLENDPPVVESVEIDKFQSYNQTNAHFPGEVWYDEDNEVFYEDATLVFKYTINDPNGCPFDAYISDIYTTQWQQFLWDEYNITGVFDFFEEDTNEFVEYHIKAIDHHNAEGTFNCPDCVPSFEERPPKEPTVLLYSGVGDPEADTEEQFTSIVEDCDNEDITIYIDWGDGETDDYTTTSLNKINDWSYTKTMTLEHEYIWADDYTVSLRAKDEFNKWSEYTNTSISIDPIPPAGSFTIKKVDGTYAQFDIVITEDGGNHSKSKVLYREKGTSTWMQTRTITGMTDYDAPPAEAGPWYAWVEAPKTGSWTQGTAYEWKGVVNNSGGSYSSSVRSLLTKPGDITFLSADKINDTTINVSWNNAGIGVDGIRLYYRYVSGGETTWTDLGYIWDEYYIHNGLVSGLYEYNAFPAAQDNGLTSDGNKDKPFGDNQTTEGRITFPPTVITTNASNVQDTSARLWGYLEEWGGENCDVSFLYGPTYAYYLTNIKSGIGHQENFYIDQSGLTPGEKYVYYARARNSEGSDSDAENISTFLTTPSDLSNVTAETVNGTTIELTWTNGAGGEGCYIEYAKDAPPSPWNKGNGTEIYNISEHLQPMANGTYGNDYRKVLGSNDSSSWKIWGNNKDSCRVTNIDINIENVDITVHARWRKTEHDDAKEQIMIWDVDGSGESSYTVYDGTGTTGWINSSHTWTICPWTGNEWTMEDINDLQIGFRHKINVGAFRYVYVSQMYVEIETPEGYKGYISGNNCTHNNLDMNTSYYYKIWPYAKDEGWISEGNATAPFGNTVERDNVTRLKPVIENIQVYNITNTTAQFSAYLNNSGVNSTVWFEWGESPACPNSSIANTFLKGPFYLNLTGLKICHQYYFKVNAENYEGTTTSATFSFFTKPNKPINFTLDEYGNNHVTISWEKAEGADYTYIIAQYDAYLWEPTGGRFIINTTGNTHIDTNFTDYVGIHYSAFSYNITGNVYSFEPAIVNTSIFDYTVFLPKYLEAGDYIISWGKIESRTNQPVVGFIANTTIKNETVEEIIGPVYWNCIDGNYQTTLPTTALEPGEYIINVRFENDIGTRLLFDFESPLHLSKEIDVNNTNTYAPATIYYSFYDIATSTGLDDNFYKIYLSYDKDFSIGDRVKGGEIQVLRAESKTLFMGETYYIQIRDYNNNIIPLSEYDTQKINTHAQDGIADAYGSFTITHPEYYVDIGLYLNQLRIKNMNESTVYISLKRTDGNEGQIVGRYIPTWEETELFIPDGYYNLTVDYYDNQHPERGPQERKYPWITDRHITTDYFAHINGSSLDDVVKEARGIEGWIYYTVIDQNTGSRLDDDLYPIYFSEDTNITESDRVLGGKYDAIYGETIYYRVTDYWGNIIYPINGSLYDHIDIQSYKTFLDIFIPFNQLLIKNENESLAYIRITTGDGTDPINNTWYNRWIPPGESQELFLPSAIYNISVEYYHPYNGSHITTKNTSNYSIQKDTVFVILGKEARVYFNVFSADNGLGEDIEALKIYIDNTRLTKNYIDTHFGTNHQIIIRDYYNNIIYNTTFDAVETITYVDVPLDTFEYKFCNMKKDNFTIQMQKTNQTITWEQIVGPYETINFDITEGEYNISVFNNTMNITEFNVTVNSTAIYVIFENTTTTIIINIQKSMNTTVLNELNTVLETFNITNYRVLEIIDFHPYYNQTINDFRQEFRETQVLKIPSLKEEYKDTEPPQTTITAVITLGGNIRITWNSVDDKGCFASYTNISYKKENATQWKMWFNETDPYGSKMLNNSIEDLIKGETYLFRALGTDKEGNDEKPNEINTVELLYEPEEIGKSWSTDEMVKDAFTQGTFLIAILIILSIVGIVIYLERKKNKKAEQQMRIPYKKYNEFKMKDERYE